MDADALIVLLIAGAATTDIGNYACNASTTLGYAYGQAILNVLREYALLLVLFGIALCILRGRRLACLTFTSSPVTFFPLTHPPPSPLD